MSNRVLDKIDIQQIVAIAQQAGEQIMQVYQQDFTVHHKADQSPLTAADQQSHHVICRALQHLNQQLALDIPILSEEGRDIPYSQRQHWECFWLIDPLDGTKEFIKKNGEFTVNIALIQQQQPVLGVVHAPALGYSYWAKQGAGAWKQGQRLPLTAPPKSEYTIVASRSHMSEATQHFIDQLDSPHPKQLTSIGSSLKICLVAEGAADIYPRLAPTMEWDTAAAHAIVNEAGKQLQRYSFEHGYSTHPYNKPELLNDWFVVK